MINVVNTPKPIAAANTSLLRTNTGALSGTNLGGRFALPVEFDTNKYAAGYYQKGHQVLAMQQDQIILGTSYVTDGWQVWKYPGVNEGSEGKKKSKKSAELLISSDKAGRPHEVASQSKDGAVFVLMFRPIELQQQVNRAYADLSLNQMVNEIRGDSLTTVPQDGGMLTHQHLNQVGNKDVEADREFEESGSGRTAAIDEQLLPAGSGRTRKRETVVHR